MELVPAAPGKLVIDRQIQISQRHVSGSKGMMPIPVSGMIDAEQVPWGGRARIDFLVHETGKLDGKFTISADLDAATTRALRQFLIDLANQAEK